MPKKKNQESREAQSARFEKAVAALVAAGELDPTEAEVAFDNLMSKMTESKRSKFNGK